MKTPEEIADSLNRAAKAVIDYKIDETILIAASVHWAGVPVIHLSEYAFNMIVPESVKKIDWSGVIYANIDGISFCHVPDTEDE